MSTPCEAIPFTRENVAAIRDGSWILVDRDMTEIRDAIYAPNTPKPVYDRERGHWWRRKQLLEYLSMQVPTYHQSL